MSALARRYIPILILAFLAFFMAGDTLIVEPTLNSYASSVRSAASIIGTFALILSITMLTRIHVRRIQRKISIIESSVLLISLWVPLIWGLYRFAFEGVRPSTEPFIQAVFNGIVSPGDSTIYAILAFFIASAAYRAFRARTLEATVLLTAGIVVMLAKAPIGESIWSGFPVLSDWILNVPNRAGVTVIIMSGILASIALYIRVILGYERGWMGRAD